MEENGSYTAIRIQNYLVSKFIYIGVGAHMKMTQVEAYDVLAVKPILVIKAGISQQEECIPFAIRVIFRERHSNGEGGMEGVSGMCSRELRV